MPIKLNGDRIARLLLLCGVLTPIMMMVIIIIVGQITPDYNPILDTISQMGTPDSLYSSVLNSGYVIYGILICGASYGFYRRLRYHAMIKIPVILLGIHAIGSILLAVFPDTLDFPGKHFTEDNLHNIISAISYIALFTGILVFTIITRQEKALRIAAILGFVVFVISMSLLAITFFAPFKPIIGLLQRLYIAGPLFWLALTSILLYQKRYQD